MHSVGPAPKRADSEPRRQPVEPDSAKSATHTTLRPHAIGGIGFRPAPSALATAAVPDSDSRLSAARPVRPASGVPQALRRTSTGGLPSSVSDRIRAERPAPPERRPLPEVLRRSTNPADPLGGTQAALELAETLRRRRGGGAALEPSVSEGFGGPLGMDLSGVRIHTDPQADTIARSVQATAFTQGADIYFTRGTYAPGTAAGDRLLAHELAHVAQGSTGRGVAGGTTIGRTDDPAEAAADRVAESVLAHLRRNAAPATAAHAAVRASQTTDIQRWPWSKKGSGKPEDQPSTAAQPTKKDFAAALSSKAPADDNEAATRMQALRTMLTAMAADERFKIQQDKGLKAKVRKYVGNHEYMTFVAALGTYTMPSKKAIKAGNAPVHMSGAEADSFIQKNMGAIAHLKPYLNAAVDAGKKAEGFIAVVGKDDWKRIYETQYDDETVGVDDLDTNAFIANTHSDRPAIIHQDRGTRSTAIHESMHRYSELAVLREYGAGLNEGITEYFTRLITDKDGNPVNGGVSDRDNYEDNWEFVCKLLSMLGGNITTQQTELAEIYFSGKKELLQTKFTEGCKAAGLSDRRTARRWTAFAAALKGQEWGDAEALFPPPPAPVQAPAPEPAQDPAEQPAQGPGHGPGQGQAQDLVPA